jgi:hypothetical protein
MRALVEGPITPDRKEDSGDLARQREDSDPLSASFLDFERPLDHGVDAFGSPRGPRGLDQGPSYGRGAGLGDGCPSLTVRARVFAGRQSQVRLDLVSAWEPLYRIEGGCKAYRGDRSHAGHGHEA